MKVAKRPNFVSTRNACKLCTPLGACLAFRGIEGCVPFLHGSQGCATYVRRYLISHFNEPVDIASSNFSEQTAIFGGGDNFKLGLRNVVDSYQPQVVGVATTCLSETIGDDVAMFLHEFRKSNPGQDLPFVLHASTPSYTGTHADGFTRAVKAAVEAIAEGGETGEHINILPGMVSPEDIRQLRQICEDFGIDATILPDYSDSLDGGIWDDYHKIPEGGTPIDEIIRAGRARATIEFASMTKPAESPGAYLEKTFGVANHVLPLPIGVRATDRLFQLLCDLSGRDVPAKYQKRRARLIDSFVDGHKYISGLRAVVYGEEEFVLALASMLGEIGIVPALCGSGARSGKLSEKLGKSLPKIAEKIRVADGADFVEIEQLAGEMDLDLIVGHSKGFKMSQALGISLVRVGFPVHDRIGGGRICHVGYRGTQELFDRVANAVIERLQADNPVGYTYM
ncbi:MAG: nitrogenase component 1 [Phycisphaerae bacterium]